MNQALTGRWIRKDKLKLPHRTRGFTLIELIIVIVLLGILAVAVALRAGPTKQSVANVTACDQAVADIQYTQMRAMANRGAGVGAMISIAFSADTDTAGNHLVYLCNTTTCNSGAAFETLKLPKDAGVGTQTFTFNTLGELTGGSNLSVTVGTSTITVYRVTGKVVVT